MPFSSFVLFLIMTDGNYPAMPNCKKSKWLNAKIIATQSWYNSIERFFQFHSLLFLVTDAILTGLFLFNFETTQCKHDVDINLVKIHLAVIEILSFSCSVLFLVTANGGHLGMPSCKQSKGLHTRNILAQSWITLN